MPRMQRGEYSQGFSYCFDCGEKYRGGWASLGRCAECAVKYAAQCVVYDRDKGIGRLPPNLVGKES
jgi:hypothetical protein